MGRRKTPLPFPETGRLIRKYRIMREYSTAELAALIGIDPKYLSNLESGAQMPGIRVLYNLSVRLNIPLERLLVPDDDPSQDSMLKEQIVNDLNTLSNDELQLVQSILYHCLPLTRRFKEY